jgi:hypothetical protein
MSDTSNRQPVAETPQRGEAAWRRPGLIACWPGVREGRMAAGCVELVRRGHPIQRVLMPNRTPA